MIYKYESSADFVLICINKNKIHTNKHKLLTLQIVLIEFTKPNLSLEYKIYLM